MNDKELFSFYEKLYFKELETREQITSRLQLPFAILFSCVTYYSFILSNLAHTADSEWFKTFYIVIFISLLLFVLSLVNFIKAFVGATYEVLPTAKVIDEHRIELNSHYEKEDKDKSKILSEEQLSKVLYDYYNICSTTNSEINVKRAANLHHCNKYLMINLIPMVIAFLIFSFSGMDKNSLSKEYEVRINNPIEIKE